MPTTMTIEDKHYTVTVYGRQYGVIIHPDTEAGGYWVECPELDVVSQGDTVGESLDMIKEAMELHLEDTENT
ncbi:MAG: type II toxin-antitoxin system HicB family antitoxin [Nitrospirae bacterium]|nr:type II toxin-antitoxin system HicB family antitoxin [Nitrospirota bacterium]